VKIKKDKKNKDLTKKKKKNSKTVFFKHLRYEVSESAGCAVITIKKKIKEDFTFWVRTVDGTAKAS
jgi:hypothetical protein